MTISPSMTVYKNKESKKPVFSLVSSQDKGDSTNETAVTFNVHSGTHVDFPRHIQKGGKTSSGFDATTFLRSVKVFDLTHLIDAIRASDLVLLDIKKGDTIFFKTTNSYEDKFNPSFVYLKESAATFLASKQIFAVGIDALGIERDQPGHLSHNILMNAGIYIIEGLRLLEVKQGKYNMLALPLKLDDVDALPLTIILEEM